MRKTTGMIYDSDRDGINRLHADLFHTALKTQNVIETIFTVKAVLSPIPNGSQARSERIGVDLIHRLVRNEKTGGLDFAMLNIEFRINLHPTPIARIQLCGTAQMLWKENRDVIDIETVDGQLCYLDCSVSGDLNDWITGCFVRLHLRNIHPSKIEYGLLPQNQTKELLGIHSVWEGLNPKGNLFEAWIGLLDIQRATLVETVLQ